MSLEKEDVRSSEEGPEKFAVIIKKPEISYTREILLSLCDLDICKKLPSGFDESLLSELEDAALSIQDRSRIPGSYPLQGFRRNQYGSSPPTRGDSSNYSRATYGKWESRSSGKSDRDSDSQSDRDSDSGRRYCNPSRRPWQSTEQDGLLGSGSFPRQSGNVSGIYAPKVRANEDYPLSKSNEPYHPPRPYKAVPYSRRDTDSVNDETFGSMECDNEDRAQEERRRRASFEMIRKEQQKTLQEQKLNLEKPKSSVFSNLSEVLEDKNEEKGTSVETKDLEVSAAIPLLTNNPSESYMDPQAPAARPVVPPGFCNTTTEKSTGIKHQTQPPLLAAREPATVGSLLDADVSLVQGSTSASLQLRLSKESNLLNGQCSEMIPHSEIGENGKSSNSSKETARKLGMEDQLPKPSRHLDSHETLFGLNSTALEDKAVGEANRKFSTSILEDIFGGALVMNDDRSNSVEHHHTKPDEKWGDKSVHSSKFAQWFSEEETKPTDGIFSGRPNELLSLIVSSNKGQCQVSDSETSHTLPDYPEQSNKFTLDLLSATNRVPDQSCIDRKEESISTVITCEDLEQSILTEYGTKTTNVRPLLSEGWNTSETNTVQTSEHVDDHASIDLLALLQKGAHQNSVSLEDRSLVSQEHVISMTNELKPEGIGNTSTLDSGKITLEALFGSAFMKELHSVDAPVSIQRGSNESNGVDALGSHGSLFRFADNIVPSSTDINGIRGPNLNQNPLFLDESQQLGLSKAENRLGLYNSGNGSISSKDHVGGDSKYDGFGVVELHPTEVNINGETNLLGQQLLPFMPTHNSVNNGVLSSNEPIEILDKLAAIKAVQDARVVSESLPFTHMPYQNMDPHHTYPGPQMHPLSQVPPPQMAQVRPLHNNMESHLAHMSSQMKLLGPEPMFNQYSSANHQFPSNMIQQPFHPQNIAGLDVQSLASMQHQMQLSGNHSHSLLNFPRGGPVSHPGNRPAGFFQETNQMQRFPSDPRQQNIGNHGSTIRVPGPDLNPGHNPPELFQKLMEMGVQANSKRANHLPSASGYNQGLYSHGLDMGFQHR